MSTKSLDDVLADADASDQDLTNETAGNEAEVSQEAEVEEPAEGDDDPGHDAHGALHAERQRVRRKYTDTVADFERKFTEATSNFDKKLAERETAINQQWEQRFNQFAQQFQQPQQQRREPEQQPEPIDPFVDPAKFRDEGITQALDPVNQRIAQMTESFSRRMAIKEHGAEGVSAAFKALDQAARSGDRDALALANRLRGHQSDDPFEEMVQWHKKTSIVNEVGNDPDAFIAKRLADPEFLAKHGLSKAPAVPGTKQQPGNPSLPSLNRVTAAADDDGEDEEEDASVVFNTALRRGVRR